ncbi:TonB-dependent receptor plug domain-containing protein [Klebsiella pneumoniae subsp. pneumoniae]|nr:TonB-dependent receptor plug domain-containing protein [Klebsiella pneumoniae subsp. pneumoniae]
MIPEQVIKDQGVTNLTDALKNVPASGRFMPGRMAAQPPGMPIFMRGVDHASSIYVDGIRDIGSVTRDTFNTQQVGSHQRARRHGLMAAARLRLDQYDQQAAAP